MTPPGTPRTGRGRLSLRARLAGAGVLLCLVLFVGALLLAGIERDQAARISQAVNTLAMEQELADRLSQGVMQNLLAIIAPEQIETVEPWTTGLDGGVQNEIHRLLRAFLDLPLSLEQRLLVEELREAHQRVEIAASHTLLHEASGDPARAAESRRETGDHVVAFLEGLDRFLAYRASDFRRLQAAQAAAAQRLLVLRVLAVFLLLTLVVGGTLSFHRRLSRALLGLLEGAERIGQGDLSARIPRRYDPEFDRVAEEFNRMAARLEEAQQDLEARNVDLTRALEEVRRTQDDLVQSEKMAALGRLSAGLAHELNNPLAAVVGFSDLLAARLEEMDTPETAELGRNLVDPVRKEAERARNLITTILGFSRRPDQETGAISIRDTAERIHVMRSSAFGMAGLTFDVADVPDLWVRCNAPLLQSVVLNLVNNALDAMATRPGGSLRVHGRTVGSDVEFVFDDDGEGFAEPDRAFEPFYTTKPPGSGTGLGLSLVYRFVQQFGGSVSAMNRPEGGARLVLRFPAAEPGPRRDIERPASGAANEEPGAAAEPVPGGPPRGATVLVVDDEASLRMLQSRILQRMGLNCLEAGSVADAKVHLANGGIDAVVSDIRMPGGSGIELLEWVREQYPDLTDRFILVTGDATHPDMAALTGTAAGQPLLKPFLMEAYRTRILEILQVARP